MVTTRGQAAAGASSSKLNSNSSNSNNINAVYDGSDCTDENAYGSSDNESAYESSEDEAYESRDNEAYESRDDLENAYESREIDDGMVTVDKVKGKGKAKAFVNTEVKVPTQGKADGKAKNEAKAKAKVAREEARAKKLLKEWEARVAAEAHHWEGADTSVAEEAILRDVEALHAFLIDPQELKRCRYSLQRRLREEDATPQKIYEEIKPWFNPAYLVYMSQPEAKRADMVKLAALDQWAVSVPTEAGHAFYIGIGLPEDSSILSFAANIYGGETIRVIERRRTHLKMGRAKEKVEKRWYRNMLADKQTPHVVYILYAPKSYGKLSWWMKDFVEALVINRHGALTSATEKYAYREHNGLKTSSFWNGVFGKNYLPRIVPCNSVDPAIGRLDLDHGSAITGVGHLEWRLRQDLPEPNKVDNRTCANCGCGSDATGSFYNGPGEWYGTGMYCAACRKSLVKFGKQRDMRQVRNLDPGPLTCVICETSTTKDNKRGWVRAKDYEKERDTLPLYRCSKCYGYKKYNGVDRDVAQYEAGKLAFASRHCIDCNGTTTSNAWYKAPDFDEEVYRCASCQTWAERRNFEWRRMWSFVEDRWCRIQVSDGIPTREELGWPSLLISAPTPVGSHNSGDLEEDSEEQQRGPKRRKTSEV